MELSAWAAVNGYTYAVLIILLVVSEMNNVVSSRSRKYKRVLILCVILLTGDSLGRMEFLMDTIFYFGRRPFSGCFSKCPA